MRAEHIKITGMTSFLAKDMKIIHSPNDHAYVTVEGYISDDDTEVAKRFALTDEIITISVQGTDRKDVLCGYIYDMEIEHRVHEKYLKLTIVSATILMDREKKIRTFQKPGTTIKQIMEYVCKDYGAMVMFHGTDIAINGMVAQYLETDWEFVKRLASMTNDVVIACNRLAGVTLDIGRPVNGAMMQSSKLNVSYCHELKHLRKTTDYQLTEKDVETVVVKSGELYELGDSISTGIGAFYIYEMKSYFKEEELVLEYTARRATNYKVPLQRNKNLIGASLDGKVSAVTGTNVQVNLDVDCANSLCGNRDFPYATVYSSEDGTGWYCMPEVGDGVRLYFPTDMEKNAYIISSVHLDVTMDENSSRTDPSIKSISNAQKKEICFSPEGITLKNNNGIELLLEDKKGIRIKSTEPVLFHSDTGITLNAGNSILINAGGEIRIEQGAEEKDADVSGISLTKDAITVEGVEFRLQENAQP